MALASTDSHHYEQQGRYTGSVQLSDEEYKINGVGVRDHAWGWGARAGIRNWLWASAQFSEDHAFNVFQITLENGADIHYGYVYRGGDNTYLRRSRLVAHYAKPLQTPTAFQLELEDRRGGQLHADARVLNVFNISHQERNKQGYHFFCANEYESNGQKGYGHSNFFWRRNAWRPDDRTVIKP